MCGYMWVCVCVCVCVSGLVLCTCYFFVLCVMFAFYVLSHKQKLSAVVETDTQSGSSTPKFVGCPCGPKFQVRVLCVFSPKPNFGIQTRQS